jgi:hypothetical protein
MPNDRATLMMKEDKLILMMCNLQAHSLGFDEVSIQIQTSVKKANHSARNTQCKEFQLKQEYKLILMIGNEKVLSYQSV